MRRRHLLWIVFCIVTSLSACATPRCPLPAGPTSIHPPIDTAKACASWHWVGIVKPGASCPQVPGWDVKPLFDLSDCDKRRELYNEKEYGPLTGRQVIQELERFCVYEIKGRHKGLGKVPFPPGGGTELVRFDQDCAILSTSAENFLGPKSRDLLLDHFLRQVGRAGISPAFDEKPEVRLAFLDTHPTNKAGEDILQVRSNGPRSWHGHTLVQVARKLLCAPNGPCAAEVTTQLALPIVRFDSEKKKHYEEDLDRGGLIGMQGQLAQAILNEVNRWLRDKEDHPESTPRHLVLNLSVAWDGKMFGGLDEEQMSDVRAGTQAVYWALQYAAAHDVLVLAAAGNTRTPCPQMNLPGSCSATGILLPAAWENGHPPDDVCDRFPRPSPLVYAVGGLRFDNTPLENARLGGILWRATYGEYPVVSSAHPDQPTKIYMGSSIATAVVSSIAAAVWDLLPGASSSKIMEILNRSGEALIFEPGARAFPGVRKISFCRAVKEACTETSAPCPVGPSCPSWTSEQLTPPIVFPMKTPPANSCQPWLFPQPGDYPCLGCPPDHKLH
jgi:Subtilase family